jgi:hypothetical protein
MLFVAGPVPADTWWHAEDRDGDGVEELVDSDGDGLWDDFERQHGADPLRPDTRGGGESDEYIRAADGRTLWEVQEGLPAGGGGSDAGDDGGGSQCGSIGFDLMWPLALLWLARRRACKGRGPIGWTHDDARRRHGGMVI